MINGCMCEIKEGERKVLSPLAPSMCSLEITKNGSGVQMKFVYGDDFDRIFYFPRFCPECGKPLIQYGPKKEEDGCN